jgi:hypothetical protein
VPAGRAGRMEPGPLCSPLVYGLCYEDKTLIDGRLVVYVRTYYQFRRCREGSLSHKHWLGILHIRTSRLSKKIL